MFKRFLLSIMSLSFMLGAFLSSPAPVFAACDYAGIAAKINQVADAIQANNLSQALSLYNQSKAMLDSCSAAEVAACNTPALQQKITDITNAYKAGNTALAVQKAREAAAMVAACGQTTPPPSPTPTPTPMPTPPPTTDCDQASIINLLSLATQALQNQDTAKAVQYITQATAQLAACKSNTTFQEGARVKTTTNLKVRQSPSTSGPILGVAPLGSKGTIRCSQAGGFTCPLVDGTGYTWWYIDYDSGPDGWSVQATPSSSEAEQAYLVIDNSTVPPPMPTPTPTPTPTPPPPTPSTSGEPFGFRVPEDPTYDVPTKGTFQITPFLPGVMMPLYGGRLPDWAAMMEGSEIGNPNRIDRLTRGTETHFLFLAQNPPMAGLLVGFGSLGACCTIGVPSSYDFGKYFKGGVLPYHYEKKLNGFAGGGDHNGSFPPGISLNSTTGVVSGTISYSDVLAMGMKPVCVTQPDGTVLKYPPRDDVNYVYTLLVTDAAGAKLTLVNLGFRINPLDPAFLNDPAFHC